MGCRSIFLIWSVAAFIRARQRVVWLNKSLDDAEKSTLSGVRNDLISRAEQKRFSRAFMARV